MHPRRSSEVKIDSDSDEEPKVFLKIRKSPVKCICPRCGITHVLSFVWTGRGTPRKYCHRCREAVVTVNSEYVYETVHEGIRQHRAGMSAISD